MRLKRQPVCLWAWRVLSRRRLIAACFHSDHEAPGFAIDVGNGKRPAGHQIDPGHEFGKERGGKLPVPAKHPGQNGGDTEVEDVIGGRGCAGERKNNKLKQVSEDSQNDGDTQARTGRDGEVVLSHNGPAAQRVETDWLILRAKAGRAFLNCVLLKPGEDRATRRDNSRRLWIRAVPLALWRGQEFENLTMMG